MSTETDQEKTIVSLRAALAEKEAEVTSATMQRDVFCEKLNEYIDKTKAAEAESARLRERVDEAQEYPAAIEEAVAAYRNSDPRFAGTLFLDLAAGLRKKLVKP